MDILYEIIKNNTIIANMCNNRENLMIVVKELIEMVDSYNRKLVGSSVYDAYEDLLGMRFLEKRDFYGRQSDVYYSPEIYPDTRKYIIEMHPLFKLSLEEDCFTTDGLIGITRSDLKRNKEGMNYTIIINLDNNTVMFKEFFDEISFIDYEFLGIKEVADLNTCEYDFSNIQFNELEDLNDFLCNNTAGWLSEKMPNKVIFPRSM